MERTRTIEMIGSFLLGGGVVAVGYEMTRPPEDPEPVVASADPGAEGAARQPETEDLGAGTSEGGETPAEPEGDTEGSPTWLQPGDAGSYAAFPPVMLDPEPLDAAAQSKFPKHGLVTSLAAIIRDRADLESPIVGILRGGTRLRVDAERTFGGGCSEGWHRMYPRGWICRAAGLKVDDAPPPDDTVQVVQPDLAAPLPYEYLRVKDEMTPFFHRLPSFEEQNLADVAGQAWYAEHAREPMPTRPADRPQDVPAVVKEYMNAGYYVTKAGEEVKSQRRFLRTTRGAYARKYQLVPKNEPDFQGRVLESADALPLHFIRRELPLMRRESEGSDVLLESEVIPKRLSTHPFEREIHIGPKAFYEDGDGLLMRSYAVGKAFRIKRPPGVAVSENWLHIDLSEQTLVAYRGDDPVFATLVSTGKQAGMTPVGVHRIQSKHVATPMRDQPPEDEAYSIDDVPWTQYFQGSVALHGAFWHAGFGLERSHGCVNLSPSDARWLFGFTDPKLPHDWHAVTPAGRRDKGSAVVVTE